ncbi:MAG TPA: alpha/beta fold hydrolase, partial [Candidatus Sulfotelmatobacter sp.]|nr:alpha/beta fold hydrolase [Candidatus Sulfotelmatobacter sp.]
MFNGRNNMQLHSQSLGHGQPLIVLHGLFGSLQNWHTVSRALAEQFRVIAVDQRNHGHSPHSDEMSYRLMAQDLEEFMRAHNLARAHVMGHSMGGKTAMQFALLYPERVEKLIVVDIAPREYVPRHQKMLEGMLSLDLTTFQTRKQMEEALT